MREDVPAESVFTPCLCAVVTGGLCPRSHGCQLRLEGASNSGKHCHAAYCTLRVLPAHLIPQLLGGVGTLSTMSTGGVVEAGSCMVSPTSDE